MSRSGKGTKKTTDFIDHDSPKYISRSDHGRKKKGDADSGTDAAHIFSFGLMNTIQTNSPGRPRGESSKFELVRDMNHDSNIRMKSSRGNRILDERRDARIARAFVHNEPIYGSSTTRRAHQAYQSTTKFTSMDSLTQQMGNMKVYNDETGRSHLLKHHHKYV
eukprot:gene11118-3179_t